MLALLALGAPRADATAQGATRLAAPPASLVGTDRLAAMIAGDSVTVLDVRQDLGLWLRAHIPGAALLNTETLRSMDGGVPNLILPAESYRALWSRLGVRAGRPVAVYASGESRGIDATYAAWLLAAWGQPVYVVDGGYGKWELEQRAVTRDYPKPARGTFAGRAFTPERATLEEVRAALRAPGVVLVDARVPEQWRGEEGPQPRRGRIPGALNHPWAGDLNETALSRTWRSPDELRATYTAQGITPDRDIIVYCNGGLESSHVWFALRAVLGYPRVRVYDGSFTEWSGHAELPVERGAAR